MYVVQQAYLNTYLKLNNTKTVEDFIPINPLFYKSNQPLSSFIHDYYHSFVLN